MNPSSPSSAAEVVVIGAGVAGAAAAWALTKSRQVGRARQVTLIDGGPGATCLSSGAFDLHAWEPRLSLLKAGGVPPPLSLGEETIEFLAELRFWSPSETDSWLATTAGRVRTAGGREPSLLDLGSLRGHQVILPRVDRASWDADALVRSLQADSLPALDLELVARSASILRYSEDGKVSDAELASRHDDPSRLEWLADQLQPLLKKRTEGEERPKAILLGPWLGTRPGGAEALAKKLGVPVGEALSGTAGVSGLRFEAARDALLSSRVRVVQGRASSLRPAQQGPGEAIAIGLEGGGEIETETVVLALGGLVGGGLVFDPTSRARGPEGSEVARTLFRTSLEIDPRVADLARAYVGSMYGATLDEVAWPSSSRVGELERMGLASRDQRLSPQVLVAGDLRAAAPRLVGVALESGLRAAALASSI